MGQVETLTSTFQLFFVFVNVLLECPIKAVRTITGAIICQCEKCTCLLQPFAAIGCCMHDLRLILFKTGQSRKLWQPIFASQDGIWEMGVIHVSHDYRDNVNINSALEQAL